MASPSPSRAAILRDETETFSDMDSYTSDYNFDERRQSHTVASFSVQAENKQKKSLEMYTWTNFLSIMYAVVLIICGTAFAVQDAMDEGWHSTTAFNIYRTYLYLGSTIFLILLKIYERKYKRDPAKQKEGANTGTQHTATGRSDPIRNHPAPNRTNSGKNVILRVRHYHKRHYSMDSASVSTAHSSIHSIDDQLGSQPDLEGPGVVSSPSRGADNMKNVDELDQELDEIFEEEAISMRTTATQKHAVSGLFNKFGCLLFGMGHLLTVAIEIEASFTQDHEACPIALEKYPEFVHFVFLLVQMYFFLKHTNVHIKRGKGVARFGYMHVLATNLVTWIRTVLMEFEWAYQSNQFADSNVSSSANRSLPCSTDKGTLQGILPFMSPFVLQYSLLAVAMMLGMFMALNVRIPLDLMASLRRAIRKRTESVIVSEGGVCSKSHTGLYFGALFMAGILTSVILWFLSTQHDDSDYDVALSTFRSTNIAANAVQLFALVLGFCFFRHLNITLAHSNTLDHSLLLVSLIGPLMINIFTLHGALVAYEVISPYQLSLLTADAFMDIITSIMQACFVIGGLQKCNSDGKVKGKPGRGAVMFLIITNVGVWLLWAMTIHETEDWMVGSYGHVTWAVMLNIGLPLQLFFRFHCSVCLADIWTNAFVSRDHLEYRSF